jgi:alkylation response protein AidB-like acyl-CoA dehydrogenase
LAQLGLLGLTIPARFGGADVSAEALRDCLAAIASGCGVTAFCYLQHVGGCRRIADCGNDSLKDSCLRDFAVGRRFLSLAYTHLLRRGAPAVRVTEGNGGYTFDGTAPWMTGWGLATDVVLAGTLPDGRSVWVVAPLDNPGLEASAPMALCAMNASATVSLMCRQTFIGSERLLGSWTAAEVAQQSVNSILASCSLSLGVCQAALDYLSELEQIEENLRIRETADALCAEATTSLQAVNRSQPGIDDPSHIVKLRSRCIDLGIRAALAAVVATGGMANSLDHVAQRLFREAMLYSLPLQTRELRQSSLDLIAQQSQRNCTA